MRRIRIVFALVALGLIVPLVVLLAKARQSLDMERDLRHRAFAERLTDELERELSVWLRREEDRPYAHYRFSLVPEEAAGNVVEVVRSPLANVPEEPFVMGYFQLDPDGQIGSPLWPRFEPLARERLGWQGTPEAEAQVRGIRTAVETLLDVEVLRRSEVGRSEVDRSEVGRSEVGRSEEIPKQKAGTTLRLGKAGLGTRETAPPEVQSIEDSSSLLLERLNRAAESRRDRPSKLETSQAINVYDFSQQPEANALQQGLLRQDETSNFVQVTPEIEADIEEVFQGQRQQSVDVRLEPMVGRRGEDGRLLLYRTVWIGQQAFRQGMVLDGPALIGWLASRLLDDPVLAARARIVPADPPSSFTEDYAYRHRFDEPFAGLAALVLLDRQPEPAGTLYLYVLTGLLLLSMTVGLFALYRMVRVTVGFSERRNNFVSSVTHELKTPLTAIRMYGEMLRDGMVPSEDKRQRYYEIMTAESERLTRLVQNVLELSRLEQKRPLQLVVGDVRPVLEDVVTLLAPHAEKEGFTLEISASEALPSVAFDRDALIQVLFNLVDNALKYGREAETKTVVLQVESREGDVAVRVLDHGPGVAKEHLGKIFEPFYRGENELTRKSQGTGIGLALVRGLIERMGGAVRGRNLPEGGFEVTLWLPAVQGSG